MRESSKTDVWGHVTLNFRKCDGAWCISSITYYMLGHWNAIEYINIASKNVYVGKHSNGMYPDSCCFINEETPCTKLCTDQATSCAESNDYRNPGKYWQPPISSMKPIQEAEKINPLLTSHKERKACSLMATI